MENDKTLFYVVAVVAVVAIIGIITVALGNSSPKYAGTTQTTESAATDSGDSAGQAIDVRMSAPIINANQCTADAFCEVNALTGDSINVRTGSFREGVKLGTVGNQPTLFVNSGQQMNTLIEANAYAKFYEGAYLAKGNYIENAKIGYDAQSTLPAMTVTPSSIIISKPVMFSNLAGEGNAYACLDSSGNLFRSTVPCR